MHKHDCSELGLTSWYLHQLYDHNYDVIFVRSYRLRRNTVIYVNMCLPVWVLFSASIRQNIAVKKTMTWSPFEGVNCAPLCVLPPLALMSAFSCLRMRLFIVTGIKAAYSL